MEHVKPRNVPLSEPHRGLASADGEATIDAGQAASSPTISRELAETVSADLAAISATDPTIDAATGGERGALGFQTDSSRLTQVDPKNYAVDGEIGQGGIGRVLRA